MQKKYNYNQIDYNENKITARKRENIDVTATEKQTNKYLINNDIRWKYVSKYSS